MLSSETARYEITTARNQDDDICVWISGTDPDREADELTPDELESLVHRGVVRELLSEERREA